MYNVCDLLRMAEGDIGPFKSEIFVCTNSAKAYAY